MTDRVKFVLASTMLMGALCAFGCDGGPSTSTAREPHVGSTDPSEAPEGPGKSKPAKVPKKGGADQQLPGR